MVFIVVETRRFMAPKLHQSWSSAGIWKFTLQQRNIKWASVSATQAVSTSPWSSGFPLLMFFSGPYSSAACLAIAGSGDTLAALHEQQAILCPLTVRPRSHANLLPHSPNFLGIRISKKIHGHMWFFINCFFVDWSPLKRSYLYLIELHCLYWPHDLRCLYH